MIFALLWERTFFANFKLTVMRDARIYISNDVWIAAIVVIIDGVSINDGVVIGAGSVVTKDLPNGYLAYGVPYKPARNVRNVKERHITVKELPC